MAKPDKSLDPKILAAAKEEFLEKGYEKASTNVICKKAGVTWGALKNRYAGKNALFCALVGPVAEEFKQNLINVNQAFHEQPQNVQEQSALHGDRDENPFVDYIYAHFDVFRLLLAGAGGSSYENYMEELVEILEASTIRFMEETGHEAVMHKMDKAEAGVYVGELKYFFDVGWADILRIRT